ncbi:LPXTG cell wall anchor domain-containing protein [Streptococcus agalactiae]|uniref:LPXTG cell wall anchor domain-containing protein n=1 Tax=Streptococcus agalactiae TaxID=1311 RepID=UPI0018661F2C|nr:LPXTG cell wall anchor domain-containing protein [Streptococcus agalactiae]MBE3600769.1 LPXTG cell wall anchor domain-containing protein [Streptococcus agalactiae]
MIQESKQVFSLRKFKTGTHSALLAKYGIVLATTAVLMGAASVSADEVTNNDNQVSTQQVVQSPTETATVSEDITSDIPSSVSANVTQEQAVEAVDQAQDTLKENVATAQEAGVVVKEEGTQEVVITDSTAAEKTSEVLTDLNKQDQAVKEATAKHLDNLKAYEESQAAYEETIEAGTQSLSASTEAVDQLMDQAKKAGLLVTENSQDLTPDYQSLKGLTGDDLRQAMAANLDLYKAAIEAGISLQDKSLSDLKEALALYQANQKAYTDTKADRDQAITDGKSTLSASAKEVDQLIEQAKKAGLLVTETSQDLTPDYQSLKGLTGDKLRQAMAANLDLYTEAVKAGISLQDKSLSDLKEAIALYQANRKAYTEAYTALKDAKSEGVADLELADGRQTQVVDLAKKNGVTVDVKSSTVTPDYVSVKGLTGEELKKAIETNISRYQEAVSDSVSKQDQSTNAVKTKLEAYLKELADYNAGIGTESGIKWTSNTTVVAGTAQKMTGDEAAVDWGNLRTAAADAIQSLNRDQNTDAKFDYLFKINGSGTVTIKNTSNGDVTLKISNIQAWQATATYLAVWGDNEGGIAWGVFATTNGTVSSGAGEGASGGATIGYSGNILALVKSYDYEVSTSNAVSTVTFNDIDNDQMVTINGLDGAKVVKGSKVSQSGNSYSAGGGDVSQSSAGVIGSHGVQFNFDTAKKVVFSGTHSTPAGYINTSIVAGIFGVASEVPKEPKKPSLEVQNLDVTLPEAPEAPTAPKVTVTKASLGLPGEADQPTPPSVTVEKVTLELPEEAEEPEPQEVTVHYYKMTTTPTPETPVTPATPTQAASVLPETGEAGSLLTVIGGVLLSGLGLAGTRKRKEN